MSLNKNLAVLEVNDLSIGYVLKRNIKLFLKESIFLFQRENW